MSENEVWRKRRYTNQRDECYLVVPDPDDRVERQWGWMPEWLVDAILREHQSATALQWAIDHTAENGSVTSGLVKAAEARIAELEATLRRVTDERNVAWGYKTGTEIAKSREHIAHRYDGGFHDDCPYCVFARGHGRTTGLPETDYYLARKEAAEAEAVALREIVREAIDGLSPSWGLQQEKVFNFGPWLARAESLLSEKAETPATAGEG